MHLCFKEDRCIAKIKTFKGFKLAAITGADMHGVPNPKNNWAITMFAIENEKTKIKITDAKIVNAIRTCNTYVTLDPILKMQVRQNVREVYLGETIKATETNFQIEIGKTEFEAFKKFSIELSKLTIYNNEKNNL